MASEWESFSVDDLTEKVAMGPFGSNIKVSTFVPSGVPVISGQHLHGTKLQDGRFNFITEAHAERLRNSMVTHGDVIFTHAGNIGQVAVIPKNSRYSRYVLSQRQFYARCKRDRILPEYLAYFFHSPEGKHKLLSNASQVGVPSIARPSTHLKSIEVPVPPLAFQQSACDLLAALESRIEHNHALAANLEAIARRLFKSWFVDFDPVRAKASGEKPAGLADDIAALFPDRFIESEIGDVPEGWRYNRLDEVASVSIGRTPPRKETRWFAESPVGNQWASIRDMGQAGMFITQTAETITDEGIERFNMRLAPVGAVLFSFKLTLGRICIVAEPMATNEAIAQIVPNRLAISEIYLYFMLKFCPDMSGESTSSIATAINSKRVKEISILVADDRLLTEFTKITSPLIERAKVCHQEIKNLTQLRNLILPRLISGKLLVEDAETIIEKAIA